VKRLTLTPAQPAPPYWTESDCTAGCATTECFVLPPDPPAAPTPLIDHRTSAERPEPVSSQSVPPTAAFYCPFCDAVLTYLIGTGVPRCPDCSYTPGLY